MQRLIISFIILFLTFPITVHSENGVSTNEIRIGQSCSLTGEARKLGNGMAAGMNTYFSKINDAGGINGRKIRLISLDDGYEPENAIRNTKILIEKDKVFALLGEVGTPTSKAVFPIIQKYKIPFIGPFTGAEFLRTPYNKYVINVRGSYYQETEMLAKYLVDINKLKKIACFYQKDDYGIAGLNGVKIALKKRKMKLCAEGTYKRNTVDIKDGLINIQKANPEAVIIIGAYNPSAEFIKSAIKSGMEKTIFCNISFVGTEALKNELREYGEGCIISQVMHIPWDTSIPLIRDFQNDMKMYNPETDTSFVSLEGYIVAKFFCMVVEKTEDLTRENFIKTVYKTGTFDLGRFILNFSDRDNQGIDEIFLTIIKDGKIAPLKSDK